MPAGTPFDTRGYGIGDSFNAGTLASGSSVPTIRSVDVKGGLQQVVDIAGRDAIPGNALARDHPDQFRQEGMLVFVQADLTTYQLRGGITNGDWVPFGGGGVPSGVTDRTNEEGTDLLQGEIVSQDVATAKGLLRTDPATDNYLSLPVGVVQDATIAPSATGEIRTLAGQEGRARLLAGLAPALGDLVIVSTTPGQGTVAGATGTPAGAGEANQSVGHIIDLLTYDGGADLLVAVQLNFGFRRII